MAKLKWDAVGERLYETGVRNGVLYPMASNGTYQNGVVWNGLTAVTESPSGAEATALYADDIKYLNLLSTEDYGATVESYTYPKEFARCLGRIELAPGIAIGQQERKAFGMSYRTTVGNDIQNNDYSYKIHLIYGAKASPSEEAYNTVDDSPEAIAFSWEVATEPANVAGRKPTASVIIDAAAFVREGLRPALQKIEEALYGTETTNPMLLLPGDIAQIVNNQMYLLDSQGNQILDHNGVPVGTAVK